VHRARRLDFLWRGKEGYPGTSHLRLAVNIAMGYRGYDLPFPK
jgi:hypothetical protein